MSRKPFNEKISATSSGERNGNSKLTQADVDAIRASRETGRVLAARYGVGHTYISNIKTRKVWTKK